MCVYVALRHLKDVLCSFFFSMLLFQHQTWNSTYSFWSNYFLNLIFLNSFFFFTPTSLLVEDTVIFFFDLVLSKFFAFLFFPTSRMTLRVIKSNNFANFFFFFIGFWSFWYIFIVKMLWLSSCHSRSERLKKQNFLVFKTFIHSENNYLKNEWNNQIVDVANILLIDWLPFIVFFCVCVCVTIEATHSHWTDHQ